MANISNYLEEALLNHVMRNNAYTSPTNVYCGLVSNDASEADLEAGTLTNEITGYTGDRKEITFSAPSQTVTGHEGKAAIQNTNLLEFLNMPAGTVKYAIICDADSAGNILYWCPLDTEKNTNAGDTFRIPVEDLTIDLD